MAELYRAFADVSNAQIFALLVIGLVFLGMLSWVWSTSKTAGVEVTHGQWAQIYIFGLGVFLCGVLIFGLLVTPNNAENLINILYLDRPLAIVTKEIQRVVLYLIRLLM